MIKRTQPHATSEKVLGDPYTFAYASLVAFVLIYFARPEDWIPGLAALRPAFIAGGLAIIGFGFAALGSRAGMLALPREMWYLTALFIQLFAAAAFSPVWRGGAFQIVAYTFSKIVFIAILITLTVTTLGRLRKVVFIQATCFASVAVVSILESPMMGGRLTGSLNGIYGNPNDLAFAIALGFPFCWILVHLTSRIVKKLGWVFCMGAMAYAVFLTASRSGLVVLVISFVVSMWEFGFKRGRRYLLVIGAGLALAIVMVAPSRLMDARFGAFTGSSKNARGYSSFQQRQELLFTSLRVAGEHPLFGVGPGNFAVVSGNWHVSHNSLTELSAEGGIAALVLFLLMAKCSFSNLRRAGAYESDQKELQLWRSGLKVAMITLMVGSLFSSIEYQFFPYMLMAYTGAFHKIASKREAREVQPDSTHADADIGNYSLRLPENAGSIATIRAE